MSSKKKRHKLKRGSYIQQRQYDLNDFDTDYGPMHIHLYAHGVVLTAMRLCVPQRTPIEDAINEWEEFHIAVHDNIAEGHYFVTRCRCTTIIGVTMELSKDACIVYSRQVRTSHP